jgi:hypothetical protein
MFDVTVCYISLGMKHGEEITWRVFIHWFMRRRRRRGE